MVFKLSNAFPRVTLKDFHFRFPFTFLLRANKALYLLSSHPILNKFMFSIIYYISSTSGGSVREDSYLKPSNMLILGLGACKRAFDTSSNGWNAFHQYWNMRLICSSSALERTIDHRHCYSWKLQLHSPVTGGLNERMRGHGKK